jgi:hypothetical protein
MCDKNKLPCCNKVQQGSHSKFSHSENEALYLFSTKPPKIACNIHFGHLFRGSLYKGHNISLLYPHEGASFFFSRKWMKGFQQTHDFPLLHTIFEKSPSSLISSFSLPPSLILYIFYVHPVCSSNDPPHSDTNPIALLCPPNWYVSCKMQPYLPSSSCFVGYITFLSTVW